jgi:hypothetical protein
MSDIVIELLIEYLESVRTSARKLAIDVEKGDDDPAFWASVRVQRITEAIDHYHKVLEERDRLLEEKKQLREEIEIRKRLQDPNRKSRCIPMENNDDA